MPQHGATGYTMFAHLYIYPYIPICPYINDNSYIMGIYTYARFNEKSKGVGHPLPPTSETD